MNEEKFKILKECLCRWQIDVENGLVKNQKGETHCIDQRGYLQMATTYKGKTYVFKVHQIIAVASGLNPVGMSINHKNGIKTDNRIGNLELVTPAENTRHAYETGLDSSDRKARGSKHGLSKLSEEDVIDIKRHLLAEDCTQRSLAEKYGVNETKISDIKHGRTWKHVVVEGA